MNRKVMLKSFKTQRLILNFEDCKKQIYFDKLPQQDYAKIKVIVGKLNVNEFISTSLNDANESAKYLDLLTLENNLFIIRKHNFNYHICRIR